VICSDWKSGKVSESGMVLIEVLINMFVLDLSYFDVAVISSFYQFSIYVMIRLSHGSFTLGEVGLVGLGTTVLFMEAVNLTIAKVGQNSYFDTCTL
jgi:hypothetical protein